MNTGSILMGRPSVGSWLAYGLGSENENMPAFVVLPDPGGGVKGGPPAWGSGFLPATYQGSPCAPDPRRFSTLRRSPASPCSAATHTGIRPADEPAASPTARSRRRTGRPDQCLRTGVSHASDRARTGRYLAGETAETERLYGLDEPRTREFGQRCLLARRMIEQGVRFVQLYSGDTVGWDAHDDVAKNHGQLCQRPTSQSPAYSRTLKRRGMLDNTARRSRNQ
jgi:hypothetical protein